MKLYELTNDMLKVVEYLDSDLSHDVSAEGHEIFDKLEMNFKEKCLNIARLIKNLSAEESELKEEIDRLSRRKKKATDSIEWLKRYLNINMIKTGIKDIKDAQFSLKIQKNNPTADILSKDLLDKKYFIKQPDKIDNASILKDLKKGEVPGAKLVSTESVRIR